MFKGITRTSFHHSIHFWGLLALAIGLVSSKAILSISIVLLVTNLVIQGTFKAYWQNLSGSRIAQWLTLFWVLHLIGLLWTTNTSYAFHDIRIKLSVLLIPLLFIGQPLRSKRQYIAIQWAFLLALLVTSFTNFAAFHQWFWEKTYTDMRELSLFGSHIRYSLLIVMGIAVSWSLMKASTQKWIQFLLGISIIWLLYYTYFSQVLSGVLALASVCVVWVIRLSFNRSKILGISSLVTVFALLFAFGYYLLQPDTLPKIDRESLPLLTAQGNPYTHNLEPSTFERGKPVLAYLCEEELRKEWNSRSALPYDGQDQKGQVLRFVIMRYLTSLDLKKDAEGVKQLSSRDIHNIEQGIARADAHRFGFFTRLEEIRMQIHHPINPNGFTLLQRMEYWKASLKIIRENWLIGVGTGDVQDAFDQAYIELDSKLLPENRLRAHNTYLTTWITFGMIGFVVFLLFIYQVLKHFFTPYHFLAVTFLVVALTSFLLEDTLETQTGASFFGFFLGLFATYKEGEIAE